MSRQSRKKSRRRGAAFQLLLLGLLFALLPLFLGQSPMSTALRTVAPYGWLMVFVGAALAWLARDGASAATKSMDRSPSPHVQVHANASGASVDRVAAEIDNMLDSAQASGTADIPPRPTAWSAKVFEVIEWRRFEAVVEALFKQAGFTTTAQSHGADGGVDVWLYARSQPDKPSGIVQCKHWHKGIGVKHVRELRGVMAAHDIRRGHFATTSTFTPDAIAFAKGNGINLLDVRALTALIARRSPEQQAALLEVALEGEYWRPTCASCGIKLVKREPRNGGAEFWGCTNYPRCKTKIWIRRTGS